MGMGVYTLARHDPTDEAKPWPFLRTLARDPRVPGRWVLPMARGVRQEYGDDEESRRTASTAALVEAFARCGPRSRRSI
jgi:hypothetical protein